MDNRGGRALSGVSRLADGSPLGVVEGFESGKKIVG